MSTYITAFALVDFGSIVTETLIERTPAELYAQVAQIGELGQPVADYGAHMTICLNG